MEGTRKRWQIYRKLRNKTTLYCPAPDKSISPLYRGLANPLRIKRHASKLIDGLSASALRSKILYRSSAWYFGLIRLRRRYIYSAARIKPPCLMLRHQYQENIFYSQTHVPAAAMRFTYELFSPLAEHTPKSLKSAAATARRTNYMCCSLLNFSACIPAIYYRRAMSRVLNQNNIFISTSNV